MFIAIQIHGLSIIPSVDEDNSLRDSSIPRLVSSIEGLGMTKQDVAVYIPKEVSSEDAPVFVVIFISDEDRPTTNHLLLELERVVTEEVSKYTDGRKVKCCILISPLIHPDALQPKIKRHTR
jgi:hypothetical protein